MNNIYELVDKLCAKVKYDVKCKEETERILRAIDTGFLHCADIHKQQSILSSSWWQYITNPSRNSREYHHLRYWDLYYFYMFGTSWKVVLCVDMTQAAGYQSTSGEQIFLPELLYPNSIVSPTIIFLKNFVNSNSHRILDVNPTELEEGVKVMECVGFLYNILREMDIFNIRTSVSFKHTNTSFPRASVEGVL